MTTEQRIAIQPEDIAGFEFECPRCKGRFFIPIEKFDSLADKCSNCREKWFDGDGSPTYVFVRDLLEALKRFTQPTEKPAVKLRFQLKESSGGR